MNISVRGYISFNFKLLLCKNKANDEDFWCLPGGRLEKSETLVEGLNREIIEEFDIKPKIGSLINIRELKINNENNIEFYFFILNGQDFTFVDLKKSSHGNEIKEINFFDISEIKNLNLKPIKLKEILPKYINCNFNVNIEYLGNVK